MIGAAPCADTLPEHAAGLIPAVDGSDPERAPGSADADPEPHIFTAGTGHAEKPARSAATPPTAGADFSHYPPHWAQAPPL